MPIARVHAHSKFNCTVSEHCKPSAARKKVSRTRELSSSITSVARFVFVRTLSPKGLGVIRRASRHARLPATRRAAVLPVAGHPRALAEAVALAARRQLVGVAASARRPSPRRCPTLRRAARKCGRFRCSLRRTLYDSACFKALSEHN